MDLCITFVHLQIKIVWSSDAHCHQVQRLHIWLPIQLNPGPNGVSSTHYFCCS